MAATFTIQKKIVAGNTHFNVVDITCDTAYPVAGYPVTAANVGVGTILYLLPMIYTAGSAANFGLVPVWDSANSTLKFYKGASTITVTAGNAGLTTCPVNETLIDASTVVRCLCFGSGGVKG